MATEDSTDEAAAEKILQEKLGAVAEGKEEKKDLPLVTSEDDIEKPIPTKEWHFQADYEVKVGGELIPQHFERFYNQKPLSYHAMIEFTGLFSRKMDEAMSGPDGLSIDKIMPDEKLPLSFRDGHLSVDAGSSLGGIDSILKSVLKLASYIPDFLTEAQCIWLRVPRSERNLLIDIWSRPTDEGGMSVRDGEEMLTLFIEQNYEELEYFLTKWWRNVLTATQRARKRNQNRAL
jgi:hypothetical protein